jgi:predicted phage terminase large subunit-like protein
MNPKLRAALRSDFVTFVEKAFAESHGKSLTGDYIAYLCFFIERIASGAQTRLVVNLPPRHLKTFVGSICLPAFILGNNPKVQIMVVSYDEKLARLIAEKIREVMRSRWFSRTFNTRLAHDHARATDFATTAGGGVRAFSIEGGITGHGADFIIIDDPLQIGDANNRRQIDLVNRLFDTTIYSRLNDPETGHIVIIAHRLHEDDLCGHVLKEGGWQHVLLPFVASRTKTLHYGDRVWRRKKGELLRPHPSKRVKRLRRDPDFESLYQQNPGATGLPRITDAHFPPADPANFSQSPAVISIDPGQSAEEKASYSVVQVWRHSEAGYFLEEQWRARADFHALKTMSKTFVKHCRASVILIEKAGIGPALIAEIFRFSWTDVIEITPTESKLERLRRHAKTIRARRIQLPADAPWRSEYVREFSEFPHGASSDQVDATSQYLDFISTAPQLRAPARGAFGGHLALQSSPRSPSNSPQVVLTQHPGIVLARRLK